MKTLISGVRGVRGGGIRGRRGRNLRATTFKRDCLMSCASTSFFFPLPFPLSLPHFIFPSHFLFPFPPPFLSHFSPSSSLFSHSLQTIEHMMSGIEGILGYFGHNRLSEKLLHFDQKYLRKIFERFPEARDEKILHTFRRLQLK